MTRSDLPQDAGPRRCVLCGRRPVCEVLIAARPGVLRTLRYCRHHQWVAVAAAGGEADAFRRLKAS
jgi:hypothetical protein